MNKSERERERVIMMNTVQKGEKSSKKPSEKSKRVRKRESEKNPSVWNSLKLMFLISITSTFHHFGRREREREIYYAK